MTSDAQYEISYSDPLSLGEILADPNLVLAAQSDPGRELEVKRLSLQDEVDTLQQRRSDIDSLIIHENGSTGAYDDLYAVGVALGAARTDLALLDLSVEPLMDFMDRLDGHPGQPTFARDDGVWRDALGSDTLYDYLMKAKTTQQLIEQNPDNQGLRLAMNILNEQIEIERARIFKTTESDAQIV